MDFSGTSSSIRPDTCRKAGSTSWVWVTVDGMAGRRGSAVDHHCIAEPAVRRLALCDAVCNLSDHFSEVTRGGTGGWARSRVLRFCLQSVVLIELKPATND